MFRFKKTETSKAVSSAVNKMTEFMIPASGQMPALAGAHSATAPGPLSQRRRRRLRRLAGIEGRRF